MEMLAVLAIWLRSSIDDTVVDITAGTDFPALLVLGIAGIPSTFVILRWMIKYQKEFTEAYIRENDKLRERVDSLELEVQGKDKLIVELSTTVGRHENQIAAHEATIKHLNTIIERRKLE